MCGIVGIISTNKNKIRPELVEKALKVISHRGPDDIDIYTDDYISFGYVRLAIRGLDINHNQPIKFNSVISFANGEVYSKDDTVIDPERNDLEDLIKCILTDELGIYDRFDSDFAVCIYDKETKTVVLSRDYYGVKPLFYTWLDKDTLLFSSEIKGLTVLLNNKYEYDNRSIMDYLLFGYPINNRTFYKNIYRLAPRTIFKWNLITNDKNTLSKELKYGYRSESISPADSLKRSVKKRLISDRKVGAHLSGGYDSSLIAYYSKNTISYYTAYYDTNDRDYLFSKLISDELSLKTKYVHLSKKTDFKTLINILDEPLMSTGALVPYQIAQSASNDSVRVLLAGQGADELFLGYSRFSDIKSINSREELLEILLNSDINMLYNLFGDLNIKQYTDLFVNDDYLKQAQYFYVNNFLSSLLHIEDHVHMHFSIENRVPYLGLDIVNFINRFGVNNNCYKKDIIKTHTEMKTAISFRNKKENMNCSVSGLLSKKELYKVIELRVFENLNYEQYKKYADNIYHLTKREQNTMWYIYNISVWFSEKRFEGELSLETDYG